MSAIELTVFVPDLHVPHQDLDAVSTVLHLIRDQRPVRVVIMGDALDAAAISKYTSDPRKRADLQTELEALGAVLDAIRTAAGDRCEIVYLEGNHEARLTKYLLQNAQALVYLTDAGDEVISVPVLLRLRDRRVTWVPYDETYVLHGWGFEHGDRASQFSAYTARAMVDRRRRSTGIGHTHRVGMYAATGAAVTWFGAEFGCLIDPTSDAASYVKHPNWQHGVGVGSWHAETETFAVAAVPFVGKYVHWGARVYGPTGRIARR